jgi:ferritin
MKINTNTLALLQKQIMNENSNSIIYEHLASWCSYNGYASMAKLFKSQAEGELGHRDKIVTMLLDSGYMPEPYTTEMPKFTLSVLEDCIKAALKTEQKTTAEITAIAMAAMDSQDCNTKQFIMWFIEEQREEEAMFIDMMDFCTNIGLFDKETPEWFKKSLRNELEKRTEESLD